MIEQDTVKLLRECDAGVKMGTASIKDAQESVMNRAFWEKLERCRDEHNKLQDELQTLLRCHHSEEKAPNPIAKTMSWMKTNVKLAVDDSDQTAADLITDGCNMGIKSLSRYLNQYKAADEVSKGIAKKLIHLEEQLVTDIRCYL